MNAPSIDIKDVLVADQGYVFGDTIHIGKEPTSPNNCVTLYDIDGLPVPDLCGDINEQKTVQVRLRDVSYLDGWSKIQAISDAFNARANEVIGGTFYESIMIDSGPFHLGYDEKDRVLFSLNLKIERRTI